jgi:hypothetical protein
LLRENRTTLLRDARLKCAGILYVFHDRYHRPAECREIDAV